MADRGDDDYNISASQVKTFSSCPKQWEFRYQSDQEPTKDKMEYLNLGSRIHEAIEDALTADSPPPLGHKEAVKAAIQNLYREKDEYEVPDEMFKDGLEYCEKAAEYIAKREPDIRGIEVREEFQINRTGMSTGVTAIMDVATQTEIWDWKTGRIRDDTPHQEKIQGSIYMAGFYSKYGVEPQSIKFVYVKEGKVRSIDPDDDIWQYMLKHAKKLIHAKETGEFPPDPGEKCYWCGYEMVCPGAKVSVAGVPYEEY